MKYIYLIILIIGLCISFTILQLLYLQKNTINYLPLPKPVTKPVPN